VRRIQIRNYSELGLGELRVSQLSLAHLTSPESRREVREERGEGKGGGSGSGFIHSFIILFQFKLSRWGREGGRIFLSFFLSFVSGECKKTAIQDGSELGISDPIRSGGIRLKGNSIGLTSCEGLWETGSIIRPTHSHPPYSYTVPCHAMSLPQLCPGAVQSTDCRREEGYQLGILIQIRTE